MSLFEITRAFCPFPENLSSYFLSENLSWPFFGTRNQIFINPKTLNLKFPKSQKFEVKIPFRRTDNLPKRSVGCPWLNKVGRYRGRQIVLRKNKKVEITRGLVRSLEFHLAANSKLLSEHFRAWHLFASFYFQFQSHFHIFSLHQSRLKVLARELFPLQQEFRYINVIRIAHSAYLCTKMTLPARRTNANKWLLMAEFQSVGSNWKCLCKKRREGNRLQNMPRQSSLHVGESDRIRAFVTRIDTRHMTRVKSISSISCSEIKIYTIILV